MLFGWNVYQISWVREQENRLEFDVETHHNCQKFAHMRTFFFLLIKSSWYFFYTHSLAHKISCHENPNWRIYGKVGKKTPKVSSVENFNFSKKFSFAIARVLSWIEFIYIGVFEIDINLMTRNISMSCALDIFLLLLPPSRLCWLIFFPLCSSNINLHILLCYITTLDRKNFRFSFFLHSFLFLVTILRVT